MKKLIGISLVLILTGLTAATAVAAEDYTATGNYYYVVSDISQENAEYQLEAMEALFEFYNSYFHFHPDTLQNPLRVKIFGDRSNYEAYISRFIDNTDEDYVYLHYSDPQRSELVGYAGESRENLQTLSHQAFIQFLRSFVPNPPLWLREGFAVYFEHAQYDKEFETVSYRENLSWLETLQNDLINGLFDRLSAEEILLMDVQKAQENLTDFYPRAWAVVSFLLHSPIREYNRLLWDSISALSRESSLQENNERVLRSAFAWIDPETLTEDFHFYIETRQTFRSLVLDGIEHYTNDRLDRAEQRFIQALNLQDENYIPYYYLGLINYSRGNYRLAEFYYNTAIDLGSDPGLTTYALSVNAFAEADYDRALSLLEETLQIDSETYREKVEYLRDRIQEEA